MCAKRALPKLRVANDWYAPTSRIALEAAYYQFVAGMQAGATPRVLGHHQEFGVLVTEFLPPSTHTIWKNELKAGIIRPGLVKQLAMLLRRIHDSSHGDARVKAQFHQPALIHSLRLSPYFLATADKYPDLASELAGLVHLFETNSEWLVHGDFSPKNILFGPEAPVILDAECATYGDAAFDLAFCITHLFLKAVWKPEYLQQYRSAFELFTGAYFDAGPDRELENRAAHYLAGFLLARIDGKSPVEYITDAVDKNEVRAFARQYLANPARDLQEIADHWFSSRDDLIAQET